MANDHQLRAFLSRPLVDRVKEIADALSRRRRPKRPDETPEEVSQTVANVIQLLIGAEMSRPGTLEAVTRSVNHYVTANIGRGFYVLLLQLTFEALIANDHWFTGPNNDGRRVDLSELREHLRGLRKESPKTRAPSQAAAAEMIAAWFAIPIKNRIGEKGAGRPAGTLPPGCRERYRRIYEQASKAKSMRRDFTNFTAWQKRLSMPGEETWPFLTTSVTTPSPFADLIEHPDLLKELERKPAAVVARQYIRRIFELDHQSDRALRWKLGSVRVAKNR
jgi:hypothetical protein